jgi:hypothetical protein
MKTLLLKLPVVFHQVRATSKMPIDLVSKMPTHRSDSLLELVPETCAQRLSEVLSQPALSNEKQLCVQLILSTLKKYDSFQPTDHLEEAVGAKCEEALRSHASAHKEETDSKRSKRKQSAAATTNDSPSHRNESRKCE